MLALLQQHGLQDRFERLHLVGSTSGAHITALDTAAAAGVPPSCVAKTMTLMINHQPHLVVTRGDQRIDMHKARTTNTHCSAAPSCITVNTSNSSSSSWVAGPLPASASHIAGAGNLAAAAAGNGALASLVAHPACGWRRSATSGVGAGVIIGGTPTAGLPQRWFAGSGAALLPVAVRLQHGLRSAGLPVAAAARLFV